MLTVSRVHYTGPLSRSGLSFKNVMSSLDVRVELGDHPVKLFMNRLTH